MFVRGHTCTLNFIQKLFLSAFVCKNRLRQRGNDDIGFFCRRIRITGSLTHVIKICYHNIGASVTIRLPFDTANDSNFV